VYPRAPPVGIEATATGFDGVRGHAVALAQLARALERGTLHHAMLFVGPKGVGKATVARALARALHCPVAPGRGCGACPTCHRIDTDRHAGLEWIVPETPGGKIKVEAARELATRLLLAPFEGDAHVVVFDPAEALTDQAFNAMLKTLEEPRPGVYFVLVASALDGLLPTILSRCATVRFGRLQDDEVAAALDAALAQRTDAPEIPAARRLLAIRLADGSPGAACELALDPTLDATHALLREAATAATRGPGAIFAGEASPLSVAWATATAGPPTGKPARERQAVMRTAELWLLDLRERLRGRDGIPEIAALAGDRQQWTRATDTLLELQTRLERNANARLAFEAALLELWSDDRAGA
jgi:DNA polymerase-3 subunit delta'